MTSRWSRVVTNGWPYLVASHAKDPTRILGYAYAQPFRDRAAYARTFEDSVYVAPGQEGRGIGKVMLAGLLGELKDLGAREVIAVVGDSRNMASIRLHKAFGFDDVGIMRGVGYKFATWLDVVVLQRSLRDA
jgi:phosphinothricin acetyltransferase